MPSIRSRLLCEGVTETVVPGHTRISPRFRCTTAVSDPAVIEEPAAMRLASRTALEPPVRGTTVGAEPKDNPVVDGGWKGEFFLPAVRSSAGLRRIIRRW